MDCENLIILGSGPAGCTAAIYAARAGLAPVIFSGNLPGGLLTQTTEVENFPGFPEGVSGYDLVAAMQSQAERFGGRVEYDTIERLELTDGGLQTLHIGGGNAIQCRALIVATGATPRFLGIVGETRFRNHGVSACATCDGAFYRGVPVVVIGGGDSAMEEAIFLTRFASVVHVIHRRDQLRASPIMAQRALNNSKIVFHWNSIVEEILGDKEVAGVQLKNVVSGEITQIECKGYFSALGHKPDTVLVKDFLDLDTQGYIRLQGNTSHTNLAGVFAAGDCADPRYRQAITAAAMGARAGIDAQRYLEK